MHQRRRTTPRLSSLETLERRLLLSATLGAAGHVDMAAALPADMRGELDETATVTSLLPESEAPGNGVTMLGRLTSWQRYAGRVGGSDALDAYRFSLAERSRVRIELTHLDRDVDLYVYDARIREVARSTRGGRQHETITVDLAAGHYLIAVVPYRSASSRYILAVRSQTVVVPPPRPRTPPATPPPAAERPATPPPPTRPDPAPADPLPPRQEPPRVPPAADAPPAPEPPAPAPLPDVPIYGTDRDWNLNAVGAPEAWANDYTGEGVVVAVLDTGVDRLHPELVDNIWRNHGEIAGDGIDNDRNGYADDVYGWNFADQTNNTFDDHLHGTHVAGTIAAARDGRGTTGVAYDVEIMPVRVLNANGSGSSQAVAAGIRYAVANGADIINLSLGGGISREILAALRIAAEAEVLVVAAAGNAAAATPTAPAIHSRELDNVISVGAHDRLNRRARFSNRVGSSGAVQVDAPGVAVQSTIPGGRYGTLSGTSMAAPHVAGLAALTLSANPALSADELRRLVVEGALRSVADSSAIGGVDAAQSVGRAVV